MNRHGFTLIEMVVSLTLVSLVAAAVGGVVVTVQRFYREQAERAAISANLREGVSALEMDLRGLDAVDSLGSELIRMEQTSLTVMVTRSVSFLCESPDLTRSQLKIGRKPILGLRLLDPARDSLLIWARAGADSQPDNVWLRADVHSVSYGRVCPGNSPGIAVGLGGVSATELAGARLGTVVRAYQQIRYLLYRSADGRWWLGAREWKKGLGWTTTQPIAGPLALRGLRFKYFDATGSQTARPERVVAIGVTLVGVGTSRVKRALGGAEVLQDSLITLIALRNNPRR